MSLLHLVHTRYIYSRRTRILSKHLAALLPWQAQVLDVGCGDGRVAAAVLEQRPDVTISGLDVLARPSTHIPVDLFDGCTLPYADRSFDVVSFVDVLHHTDDPAILLREAARVARQAVVLKDHTRDGLLATTTLRLMDWVGNRHHRVVLPYNYWTEAQWRQTFAALGLTVEAWQTSLGIYVQPAGWPFERSLHFVARLRVPGARPTAPD